MSSNRNNIISNRNKINEDGVYFTPKHKVHEIMQRRKLESEQIEQEQEYTYELSDPPGPHYSNEYYYEHSSLEDEYVLPSNDRKTIQPQQDVTPRPSKKKDVRDLYDEDGYALPDIDGCVTKHKGVLKDVSGGEEPRPVPKEKKSKLLTKKMKITLIIVLLFVVGGIGGIVVFSTLLSGIYARFLYNTLNLAIELLHISRLKFI